MYQYLEVILGLIPKKLNPAKLIIQIFSEIKRTERASKFIYKAFDYISSPEVKDNFLR